MSASVFKKDYFLDKRTLVNGLTPTTINLENFLSLREWIQYLIDNNLLENLGVNSGCFIETTYAELYDLTIDEQLEAGCLYLITDYQTIYDQPDYDVMGAPKVSVTTKTSAIEPMVAQAISPGTLNTQIWSVTFPRDYIEYDISVAETEYMQVPCKGLIRRRKDTQINVDLPYDWRTVLFKRYESSPGSGIFSSWLDNGNDSQEFLTFVGDRDVLTTADIEILPMYPEVDFPFLLNNNVFFSDAFSIRIGIINCNNTFIGETNTIQSAGFGFIGNTFLDTFSLNTVGANFAGNEVVGEFAGNKLGDFFANNDMAGSFTFNVVGDAFMRNTVGDQFGGNVIGQNCTDNSFGTSFANNKVGNSFINNTVGNDSSQNTILHNCNNNAFGDSFNDNYIESEAEFNQTALGFEQNKIGKRFGGNVFYASAYQNTFGHDFTNNRFYDICGSEGFGNKFGDSVQNNNFYYPVLLNTVSNIFTDNTFQATFYGNNIRGPFVDNYIYNVVVVDPEGINAFVYNDLFGTFNNNTLYITSFYLNELHGSFSNNNFGYSISDLEKSGVLFVSNEINASFSNNDIINTSFFRNRIKSQFSNNIIDGIDILTSDGISDNEFLGEFDGNTLSNTVLSRCVFNNESFSGRTWSDLTLLNTQLEATWGRTYWDYSFTGTPLLVNTSALGGFIPVDSIPTTMQIIVDGLAGDAGAELEVGIEVEDENYGIPATDITTILNTKTVTLSDAVVADRQIKMSATVGGITAGTIKVWVDFLRI